MTAYPKLTIRVDVVTRALLAVEGIRLEDVIHRYEETYTGYECNDDGLVRMDEFAVPLLRRTTSDTYMTINAYMRCGGEATLYGPDQNADGTLRQPLLMVHGINLAATAGAAATGRPLRDVVTIGHPALEILRDCPVADILNGDARPTGGEAYCHIMFDWQWETQVVHLGRR